MRNLWNIVVLVIALGTSGHAGAQSYEVGYDKYRKADIKGATRALQQALKSTNDAAARAKIVKLLGMCHFMDGDAKGAAKNFQDALALDPDSIIVPGEALDDDVVAFFDKQRVIFKKKGGGSAPVPDTGPVTPEVISSSDPVAAPGAKTSPGGTTLTVTANATEGNILIDGILVGRIGEAIRVPPGAVTFEVMADGYETRNEMAEVVEGQANTKEVVLEPPAPDQVKKKKKKKKKNDYASEEPPRKKKKKKKKKNRRGRDDDDMFGGGGRRGGDLTSEFEKDSGSGYSPYTQPQTEPGYQPAADGGDGFGMQRSKQEPESTGSVGIALLPFGAGQFQNGDYLLGVAFAGGQIGGIAFAITKKKSADDSQAERDALINQRNADGQELDEEDTAYVETTDSYISKQKTQMYIGAAAFGGLWAISAIEALATQKTRALESKPKRRAETKNESDFEVGIGVSPGNELAPMMAWKTEF